MHFKLYSHQLIDTLTSIVPFCYKKNDAPKTGYQGIGLEFNPDLQRFFFMATNGLSLGRIALNGIDRHLTPYSRKLPLFRFLLPPDEWKAAVDSLFRFLKAEYGSKAVKAGKGSMPVIVDFRLDGSTLTLSYSPDPAEHPHWHYGFEIIQKEIAPEAGRFQVVMPDIARLIPEPEYAGFRSVQLSVAVLENILDAVKRTETAGRVKTLVLNLPEDYQRPVTIEAGSQILGYQNTITSQLAPTVECSQWVAMPMVKQTPTLESVFKWEFDKDTMESLAPDGEQKAGEQDLDIDFL